MTLYIGMSRNDGQVIADTDHLRQSVRDILLTPQGSRLGRRTRHCACRLCLQSMWR
ncbi:phage baseplate assembly protein W [Salmonella enterica subsp. enterica serovar Typhi]|nr:phage baseplate assembly protein W [Salmonella enterica subsp. enterica serovar Typhi]